MHSTPSAPSPAVLAFRALHESGCFVLPNPWDAGTAVVLRQLGFKALATTSAGMAFARGLPDDVGAVAGEDCAVCRHQRPPCGQRLRVPEPAETGGVQ